MKEKQKQKTARANQQDTYSNSNQVTHALCFCSSPDSRRVWQHDFKRYGEEDGHHRKNLPGRQSLLGSRPAHWI